MAESTMELLKRTLKHPKPEQLWAQFVEIVESRTYLQYGVEVNPGDTVLDVGANVGVSAAFFATECDAGAVHCFEPIPTIFSQLEQNLANFPRCIPHNFGISSTNKREEITFYTEIWAMSGAYSDPSIDEANLRTVLVNLGASEDEAAAGVRGQFVAESVECEFQTISQVLHDKSITFVDLLKIDAERAELDVLAGIQNEDWSRIKQVVGELHLEEPGRTQVREMLRGHGFQVRIVQDPAMRGTPVHLLYAVRQ